MHLFAVFIPLGQRNAGLVVVFGRETALNLGAFEEKRSELEWEVVLFVVVEFGEEVVVTAEVEGLR